MDFDILLGVLKINSFGVYIKIGIVRINDKMKTPTHNSFQINPKLPKIEINIEENTIPKPTPIECEVLNDFFPKA